MADYRKIRADIGLVGDGAPGISGEQNSMGSGTDIAYLSLFLKNQQDERDANSERRNMPRQPQSVSKYCEEHTCKFFFDIKTCTNKKFELDTVCNEHTVCVVSNCLQGKGQYMDPQYDNRTSCKYLRHEYCLDHLCSHPDCKMMCDEVAQNKFGRFCLKHRCYYKGCLEKSIADKAGHCVKHKCQFFNCTKLSVDGYELCKKHVECYEKNCSRPRHVLPNSSSSALDEDRADGTVETYDRRLYLLFCTAHGICSDNVCKGLRLKDAMHCRKHACGERGCVNGYKDMAKYCNIHRCTSPDCQNPKTWKEGLLLREEFCLAHLCRNGDCSSGTEDMHLYCKEHECSKLACAGQVAGNGLCHEHAILENTEITKEAAKSESQAWIRILHHGDYSPAAAQQPSPHMRGRSGLYDAYQPYQPAQAPLPHRQRTEERQYGHTSSSQTPVSSRASAFDDDEVAQSFEAAQAGLTRSFAAAGGVGINGVNGNGSLPNAGNPQRTDAPANRQPPLIVPNAQSVPGEPGRMAGGGFQRPQGHP